MRGTHAPFGPGPGPSPRVPVLLAILLFMLQPLGARPGETLAAQSAPSPNEPSQTVAEPFSVFEASIPEIQEALATGRVTSVELVDSYLARIAAYDQRGPGLNSIIRLNPDARAEALALDRARADGRVRGSLHGIPVVVKDNYDVRGMPTTASTLALAGLQPPDDAFQVRKLREAGAVILAKTNLHELASGITTVSSLGGQTRNPYDPFRNPGGSSGGTGAAVAASFAAVGWGSDTCGSIRIPAALNTLVGLRPTKGISSIDGIIPLSHSQDVGGPLARTARDLAIALDATVGYDPADPATEMVEGRTLSSFVEALDAGALNGVRIGSLEPWMEDADDAVSGVVRSALERMAEEAGAEIVPVELPEMDELLENTSLIAHEFKFDLADYLAATPGAPVDSLGRILELGLHHEALDGVLRLWNRTESPDTEEARQARENQRQLRRALQSLLMERDLDALAYPTLREEAALIGQPAGGSSCALSARSGLPAISIPAGFTDDGVPVGLELLGRPMDDQRLVAMAHAWEELASPRRAPFRTPPLDDARAPEPVVIPAAGSEPDTAEPPLVATFAVDLARGELDYEVAAPGVDPNEVHGFTLERRRGDGPQAVVRRLAGPGNGGAEGTLALTPSLFRDLVRGNLSVGLYTTGAPLGLVRLPLEVDFPSPPRRPYQGTTGG
ncbi:MAG: amidase family protein [Longimicrobiales bacterium]|nr:amidase family protein [Longimicrobiales bacterium]